MKNDLTQTGMQIPWCLRGFLVINLIGALAIGSSFHPQLSPEERVENALSAYICLDIGRLMANESSQRNGLRKGTNWLAPQTHECLQSLCALVCIAAMGLPGNMPWCPHRSSELPLEQFFGSLRKQFSSSQMRMRDYMYAATRCMFEAQNKAKNGCLLHDDGHAFAQPVCEEAFARCAERALTSATKLMACSSEPLDQDIRRMHPCSTGMFFPLFNCNELVA